MLKEAVGLIVTELRTFMETGAGGDPLVVSGNIAMHESTAAPPDDTVVASLVNIAEESTFKNAPHFERNGNQTRYRNAPVFLNLYLLFSANFKDYDSALHRLSQVITFFQGKNTFNVKNSPPDELDEKMDIRLTMELFALTFEQVNYLWASLGGKQMPFALYKVRMARIQADRTLAEGEVIKEIVADTRHLMPSE